SRARFAEVSATAGVHDSGLVQIAKCRKESFDTPVERMIIRSGHHVDAQLSEICGNAFGKQRTAAHSTLLEAPVFRGGKTLEAPGVEQVGFEICEPRVRGLKEPEHGGAITVRDAESRAIRPQQIATSYQCEPICHAGLRSRLMGLVSSGNRGWVL